jgi:integrase
MPKKEMTLEAVNARLKLANMGVSVRQFGTSLHLRATLPPKPTSKQTKPTQTTIGLGVYANPAGFQRAEAEAHRLGAQLAMSNFDWAEWSRTESEAPAERESTAELIDRFKKHYMENHSLSDRTWVKQWQNIYKRLPMDKALTPELLISIALATAPNTRDRKQTCQKLQKLADFAEIEVSLSRYQGNYGQSKVEKRDLPSDKVIAQWRDQIPNPNWQWVYGMMAAFGLRDHECFFCEFTNNPYELKVLEGKTGARITRALYPEWCDRWDLQQVKKPNVTGRNYEDYGDRVGKRFRSYGLPFVPYDLRHAYAIRGSVGFQLPVAVMAELMGHSPELHFSTYNRWISHAQHLQAYEQSVNRGDRAPAP